MGTDFTRMDTDLKCFPGGPDVEDANASVFIRG
jgi:hypothetical protein